METCRTRKLTQLIDLYFYCFVMYTVNVFQLKYLLKFLISFLLQYQSVLVLSSSSKESCQNFVEPLIRFIAVQLCFVLIVSLSESLSAMSLTGAVLFLFLLLFASFLPPKYLLPESCFSELLNAMQDRFLLFCKHTHMLFYRRRPIQ